MGQLAGPRFGIRRGRGHSLVRTILYKKLEQHASDFAQGQTALGLLVPYNALEAVLRCFYTSFMYLGSVVAALP
jgi:hypothetical protein